MKAIIGMCPYDRSYFYVQLFIFVNIFIPNENLLFSFYFIQQCSHRFLWLLISHKRGGIWLFPWLNLSQGWPYHDNAIYSQTTESLYFLIDGLRYCDQSLVNKYRKPPINHYVSCVSLRCSSASIPEAARRFFTKSRKISKLRDVDLAFSDCSERRASQKRFLNISFVFEPNFTEDSYQRSSWE